MSHPPRRPLTDEQIAKVYETLANDHVDAQERSLRERSWQRLERRLDAPRPGLFARFVAAIEGFGQSFQVSPARVAGFVAMAVAITSVVVYQRETRELRYEVIGAHAVGGWVQSEQTPVLLQFSDGSELQLRPESRLNVSVTGRRSAITRISEGDLRVEVQHADKTDWRFFAGPFEVRVVGTKFDLAFRHGKLNVAMREGRVRVVSQQREWTLGAGERLELSAADTEVSSARSDAANAEAVATELAPERALNPAASGESLAVADSMRAGALRSAKSLAGRQAGDDDALRPEAARQVSARRRAAEAPLAASDRSSWRQLLVKGEFAALVASAREGGIDNALQTRSADELVALAQAARYERELSLARKVWTSVRARFQGTTVGRDASFFLGRISEQMGDTTAALELYRSYLREGVRGSSYAPEALGRRLVILKQTRALAREDASAYLSLVPNGPYAKLARELLQVTQPGSAVDVKVTAGARSSSSSAK